MRLPTKLVASRTTVRAPVSHIASISNGAYTLFRRLFVVDDATGSLVGYVDHHSIDRAVQTNL